MRKPLPPITWFRAFDATARHLSFTRAAHELGFTQSAISQNVRALEDKLGTALFVRGHRALSLTEAGRLLVPDVAAAMAQLEQATERFLPATHRRKLTVAVSVSIAQWIIVPRIADFTAAYPDCALQIATAIWPDDFASTTADIEIRFGRKEVVGAKAVLMEPSILQVVATPQIAARVARDGLSAETLIQPVGISTGWSDVIRRTDAQKTLEPKLFVDSHGLAVDLAVAGAGVALTHSQITRHPLDDGRLAALPFPVGHADEGFYLARKSDQHKDLQETFVQWFANTLQ